MVFFIILLVVAVFLYGCFLGYENAFVALDGLRIRLMAEGNEHKEAKRLLGYLRVPDKLIASLLVGTMLCLAVGVLAAAHIVEEQMSGFGQTSLGVSGVAVWAAFAVFFCAYAVISETLFRAYGERWTLALLPLVRVTHVALAIFSLPVAWVTDMLLRVLGETHQSFRPFYSTRDDVRVLVDESADRGSIEREEQEMIHSVIDLQTRCAKEIMAPRVDIEALPNTASRDDLVAKFEETGKTRIPIYNGTIDNIIGVANAYDLLSDRAGHGQDIGRFVREVVHVPDTTPVDDLLELLKKGNQHMAIVTDEYGGTDGLVTLEDALEEIFGEIHDEYDREEHLFQRIGDNAYVVDGRMALDDLAEAMDVDFANQEVETVSGWVMHTAGRIPVQGEIFTHDRYKITVLASSRTHISRIRLEILGETDLDA